MLPDLSTWPATEGRLIALGSGAKRSPAGSWRGWKEGQASGAIRPDTQPFELAGLFSGIFMYTVVSWLAAWQSAANGSGDETAELEGGLMVPSMSSSTDAGLTAQVRPLVGGAMPETNLELVRQGYETWNRGDWDPSSPSSTRDRS
jgi:hypothetical protein